MHNTPMLDWLMLEDVVRRAGWPAADIVDWSIHKLAGGHETISDVYGVDVHLQRRDGSTSQLNLILKVIRATPERRSAQHWNYWRREAELYQSGLLSALPAGIAAPHCYRVVDLDDAVWLWLERVPDLPNAAWSETEIGRAAFELGQFNAAYLAPACLPADTSVPRNWIRHYVEAYVPFIEQLPNLQTHPLIGGALTPGTLAGLLRLTAQREQLLSDLDNLPQVFCHMDAWRGNLFLTGRASHEKQLVLIDWSFAGLGAIGQELAPLLFTNRRVPDVDALVCQNYAQGLRDAGWQGNDATIVRSSAIAVVLMYGVAMAGLFISNLLDEREHASLEAAFGKPVEQLPPRLMGWVEFGLHHAEADLGLGDLIDKPDRHDMKRRW